MDKQLASAVVWQQAEGFLYLTVSKDPNSLSATRPADVCLGCSLKLLSGMMQLDLDKLQLTLYED